MSDENYYLALEVLERINCCAVNCSKLSKLMGYKPSYFGTAYGSIVVPKVKKLKEYAKALDVSYEYLLTGKNKSPYKEVIISFDKIIKDYYLLNYGDKNNNNNMAVILQNLKRGKTKDLCIKTLFNISDMLKQSPYKLITEV